MEGMEVKNEQGELVLPQSQFNPVNPVSGAQYVSDEQYETLKGAAPAETVTETTEAPVTTEATVEATKPDIDYDAILKEKTGGKYEKWEDVMARLSEETQEKIEFSDNSKKIIEALRNGQEDEIAEILYHRKVLAGVDKMDDAAAIKLAIQVQNPDYTEEDVDDEYDQKYGIGVDKDDMDDAEYKKIERRANRKLSADAKASREFLTQLRDDIKLPDFKQTTTTTVDPEAESFIKETEAFGKQFSESLENTLQSFDKLDLSIADQDVQFKHEYSISDLQKTDLRAKANDYWQYLQSRYSKDGKYDTRKLAKDVFILENFDSILKSSVTRASNLAKVELVKGVANVSESGIPSPANNHTADSALEARKRFQFGE